MKSTTFIILIVAILALIANAQSPTKTVTTPNGTITGYLSNNQKGYEYRGVRYTNPYTRWTHSTVQNKQFGSFDAKFDSPGCPQQCALPKPEFTCPATQDELSCLTVNIFTPSNATGEVLPVMVYYPGGNYFQGTAGTPLYNGTNVADMGRTVVVVANYRLGILGYYRDEANGIYGNYGLVDQLNVLKWVKTNIASFGGDANNVTLFGQSAGAGSTSIALISKYFDGLFHKAIVHSNPFAIPFRSIKTKEGLSKAYRKNTGCDNRACLLALSTDDIILAQGKTAVDLDAASGNMLSVFIPFNPYVETPGQEPQDPEYPGIVPYQPQEAFMRGLVKDVPIMIGAVKNESDVFIFEAFDKDLDDVGYGLFGWLIFGDEKNKKIQAKYPPVKGADNREGLCTLGTEFIFQCSTRNATRAMINTSVRNPVYTYLFDAIYSFNPEIWGPGFEKCNNRVCHAADLPAFWNSAQWHLPFDSADQLLADQLTMFWTNFAWTGNPNKGPSDGKVKLNWEQYGIAGKTMYFDLHGSKMVSDYMGDQCNWWDKEIGYFL